MLRRLFFVAMLAVAFIVISFITSAQAVRLESQFMVIDGKLHVVTKAVDENGDWKVYDIVDVSNTSYAKSHTKEPVAQKYARPDNKPIAESETANIENNPVGRDTAPEVPEVPAPANEKPVAQEKAPAEDSIPQNNNAGGEQAANNVDAAGPEIKNYQAEGNVVEMQAPKREIVSQYVSAPNMKVSEMEARQEHPAPAPNIGSTENVNPVPRVKAEKDTVNLLIACKIYEAKIKVNKKTGEETVIAEKERGLVDNQFYANEYVNPHEIGKKIDLRIYKIVSRRHDAHMYRRTDKKKAALPEGFIIEEFPIDQPYNFPHSLIGEYDDKHVEILDENGLPGIVEKPQVIQVVNHRYGLSEVREVQVMPES